MQNKPQDAFRCGPSALQELSLATKHKILHPELIKQSRSTIHGIALSDVQSLAGKIGLPMQMAKRTPGSAFIVPAVIHWKLGHYAALVGTRHGMYVVHDTTFGGEQFLVSAQALEKETSGYFLVPVGNLPQGWSKVDAEQGGQILGRGNTSLQTDIAYTPNDGNSGDGDCGNGGTGDPRSMQLGTGGPFNGDPDGVGNTGNNTSDADWTGEDASDMPDTQAAMTAAFVKAMLVSLNLLDTPIRYAPPVGPAMHFSVHYNQREVAQPATFTYSNLGPNWTFSYLSYVRPSSGSASVYVRGGGVEMYYFNADTNGYYPNQVTQAVLSQVNATTWQRALPGGEIETYGQPDGSGNFFLSKITDPLGNSMSLSYDSEFRLIALTDALGQVTTLTYGLSTDPYKITQVTDPFGRSAQFNYDSSNRLQKITDIIGITSQFTYSSTNFVTSLTTPYGVTNFGYGDITTDPTLGSTRWLEITYPDGNKTRTEYRNSAPGIYSADPQGIPGGMYPGISTQNYYMDQRDTYYWDKAAMKNYAGSYTQAQNIHWLHTSDINTTSDIQESLKKVDQNRIWYSYAGQPQNIQASDTMLAKPSQKGRILDDGTTQLYQYQYNAIGRVTQSIDPLGRETDYIYAANNIDLLTVEQKNGSGYDILSVATYNNQHEPLTTTDASGQSTTYVYYPNGQLHTVTNAKGQTTTNTYNSSGYLVAVTGPVAGATVTFSYDGFGRVNTVTDSQGYTTTTNYDAMNRPTQISYPDGTMSQMVYRYLDIQLAKDRLGRLTRYFYNSIRQPVSVVDSLGHVTTSNWTLSAGLSSIVDPSGHVTAWQYDAHNRPVEKDYPDGTKQLITYENTTNRVKTVTDAKGQVATSTYNLDNTVSQVAYTGAAIATPTVSYTYDPVYPRVLTLADGTGTTTYTYNPVASPPALGAGRLYSMQTPLTTISYAYDELGRQLSQTIGGVAASVTYDTLGRVVTATNALSTTPFAYSYLNNTGRVTSITNPNGQQAVYTYQDSTTTPNEPRLSEIKNVNASGGVISKFDYGYDAQGQITSWTQQTDSNHPQNWAIQYDLEGKLTGVNVRDTVTSTTLHQYAYLYDAAGNRTTEQIDGNATGASYNNLNQLTGQSAGGKMVFSGSLSEPSQVTVGGNAATTSYSTNFTGVASVTTGTNNVPVIASDVNGNVSTNTYQVVVAPSSASFTYDLNGNLTQDATRSYQWDAKNELTAIIYNSGTNAGNHTEFTYNGAGQRVKIVEATGIAVGSGTVTSTKQYIWAGGIAEEHDGSNTVTKRYFGQGEQRIVSGTTTNYFYTRDHLGSIREVMAADGTTIAARYSYDPFGRRTKVSGSLDCDLGFTGYYHHAASGLDFSATRPYDSNTGRFIQRDRRGEGAGLNLYAYCGNNPINYVDLLGFDRTDAQRAVQFAHGLVGIGVAALAVGALVGSLSLVAVASPIIVGGAVVISAVTIAAAGIYGLANMAAAFSPNTPEGDQMSKTAADLPASADELTSKIITGSNDVGKTIDSISTVLTGEAADRLLDAIDDVLDQIDDQLNDSNSPSGGGSGGGCIDSPPMTAPPMGLTPDGLRP